MLGILAMATTNKTGKADQYAARKARLAAALRENLKRRKQQVRQRGGTPNAPGGGFVPRCRTGARVTRLPP